MRLHVLSIPAALLIAPMLVAEPSASVDAYGTVNETRIFYGPADFSPVDNTATYTRFTGLQATGGPLQYILVPHLPNGAVITSMAMEYCDSSATNNHMHLVLGDCDETVGPCGALMLEGEIDSVSSGCHIANGSVAYAPDNFTHRPLLQVLFDAVDPLLSFRGAFLGYRLQVSPAPATATFNDVPTDHPFFQFIEALAGAGITGGCGNGNYCPDAPLTRGQMAVFLAKALGLNWPD